MMKNRVKYIALIAVSCCYLFYGCTDNNNSDVSPSISSTTTPVQSEPTTTTPPTETERTYPTDEFADAAVFEGLEVEHISYSSLNSKENRPQTVCFDNEDIYYVDVASDGDGYVYKYSDGKSELFLEMYAASLNVYDGYLWFVSPQEKPDYSNIAPVYGYVYKCSLEDKSVELVLEEDASNLQIINDGIYYVYGDTQTPYGVYEIIDKTAKRLYKGSSIIDYGGYWVEYRYYGDTRENILTNGEKAFSILQDAFPDYSCIDGDFYYFQSSVTGTLTRLNLKTGEVLNLNHDDEVYPKAGDGWDFRCWDYTVLNGEIYFTGYDAYLYKYDGEKYVKYDLFALSYLYTDGKNIYAYYGMDSKYVHKAKFGKLVFDSSSDTVTIEDLSEN